MIVEIVVIDVLPGTEATFEANVATAGPLFLATPTCHDFAIWRSVEVPGRYHLRITWDSIEAHEQFRTTDSFARWRALVGSCFAAPPVMEHGSAIVDLRRP